jgi:transposase
VSGTRRNYDDAVRARARDQALRRLGLEHLDAYRKLYRTERRRVSSTVRADRARKRAVGRALRALERQHRHRYMELFEQELRRALAASTGRRLGRPPGTPARLTVPPESAVTWRRDGDGAPQVRQQGEGAQQGEWARQRAERQAVRQRAAALFEKDVPASSVARQLGVARQTAVRWHASWRAGGAGALVSASSERQTIEELAAELFAQGRSPSQVASDLRVARRTVVRWHASWRVGGAAALRSRPTGRRPRIPDSQLPAIERALLQGATAHGFDSDAWTSQRIGIVIHRLTGQRLARSTVQRLLHDRLGWTVQGQP